MAISPHSCLRRYGCGPALQLSGRFLIAAIAVAAPGAPLLAQDHDVQQWTQLTLQGRINEKIVVQADIQSRLTDDASRLGVIQISPSVGYKFSKNVTAVAGYMFAHTDPADRPAKDEHRLYEQVTYPLAEIGKTRLTARTRIEERMVVGSQDVVWRLRQQARAQVPLMQGHGPVLVAWTEAFYNLNGGDWGARAGPDRWRNFLGIDVTVGKHIMLEPGVIEQIVFRKGKDHFDHIASITMTYKF